MLNRIRPTDTHPDEPGAPHDHSGRNRLATAEVV